ncbi:hypothetical protein [Sphingomonas oligophenolica]|uniref:Uncharacterized protein n=1 Tax=Sphingomonas oligophenolica TaxID=301154 RepID=A0A502CGE9_9SPHN|nr:hypothetical protein [Sphingomonas oligophenolica]TPG12805.1 hypothetical protein EAH84_08570 [Sphingomonas oligophenolica]
MIVILLAAMLAQTTPPVVANIPPLLGAIGTQSLPKTGCAAFLWSTTDRALVAMAVADPAMLRLSIDGKTVDLARSAQQGAAGLGFGATTSYAADGITARLEMTIVPRENLALGAQVPEASLQVDRAGRDTIIAPVAGLVGCTT